MEHTQRPGRHPLIPSQYKRDGPLIGRLSGCGLVEGRKEVYFEVPTKASFGGNSLLGWHFAQKRQAWLGPLHACHRGKCSENLQTLSIKDNAEMEEGEETKQGILSGNGEWCSKHTLSKGSGRATNGLVGKPGEMPTRNQKWLVKP